MPGSPISPFVSPSPLALEKKPLGISETGFFYSQDVLPATKPSVLNHCR